MSTLVGLSGAQGGGKSSLLKELAKRGWHVDDYRVSRAVQDALGWDSLDRVLDSFETMQSFQEEVYKQKFNREMYLKRQVGAILTERTFADLAAYTQSWTWKFFPVDSMIPRSALRWLTDYIKNCQLAQNELYDGVLLLPLMDHVVFEDDPHRAKKEDAEEVYNFIGALSAMTDMPKLVITQESIEDRATEVEDFLKDKLNTVLVRRHYNLEEN